MGLANTPERSGLQHRPPSFTPPPGTPKFGVAEVAGHLPGISASAVAATLAAAGLCYPSSIGWDCPAGWPERAGLYSIAGATVALLRHGPRLRLPRRRNW